VTRINSSLGLLLLSLGAFAQDLPVVLASKGPVRTMTAQLPGIAPGNQYSILYSLDSLANLKPETRVTVSVDQGGTLLLSKTLHAGDADFYSQFRISAAGPVMLRVEAIAASGNFHLQVNRWPLTDRVKSNPSHSWQSALKIPLGQTIFAHGDDAEYIPLPGASRSSLVNEPDRTDWYRIDFSGGAPKLIFFQVELMERDQIPVNVSVFRIIDGKPVEFHEGEDPVTSPHEVQALNANKFTPRMLKEAGAYYLAVRSSHPEYKLVTRVYNPPPYADARQAVRTAVDYILAAGDSWHANTPRRGGVFDRVSSVHQETSLCVGCHTTHFPLRAALYALRDGYAPVQREELQFLTERFYNNPRPFYGFEEQGAVWARVISAPANVLGRMSHLLSIYEDQITGSPRADYREGVQKYLNLYYSGRDKLPPDETNGNTPLVSAHEVAWYAWTETNDPKLPEFVAEGPVTNVTDLCYQTLALADMDHAKYSAKIAANVERLFSRQRPDGQWSYKFEADQPEVEFQTGHVLWTLHEAGVPVSDPHVEKALKYLLDRQQPFGGWFDPLQSFENFRTPFRETQFAILALAAYYPMDKRAKGWNSTSAGLPDDPVGRLGQLDKVWDAPSAKVKDQIRLATKSNDALIRQAAAQALGRLGDRDAALLPLLSDPSKMVQRTAAWAIRQAYSRHSETPSSDLLTAMRSPDDRARWGAARVFAQHFSELGRRADFEPALAELTNDRAVSVEMMSIKGLWQFWFWSPDSAVKGHIEDTLLAKMATPQAPWIESNLHDAIYNLADENIRYLYNNWTTLLARPDDRARAIEGRLTVEARLANKFAMTLDRAPDAEKKELLRFLTEFPLRRADVYDLEADLGKPSPPVYNRIGNDVEQIVFFGASANRLAHSLAPLLDSKDPEMAHLAAQAVLLVRDSRFPDVNKIAGPMGAEVKLVRLKVEAMPGETEVLKALNPPPPAGRAGAIPTASKQPAANLDEAYFTANVRPILERKGKDGYACVECHATHTIFHGDYRTAMKVADPAHPEDSLILRKPTSSSESEGVAGAMAHGGGIRFTKDSPEYNTILNWIRGAKK
jgi:Squalene-hopene cyclase C-terminal domain/HEAT repeats